ncbi:3-ketodihydrosphingosine reductase-like [Paramacrobiotus metropolitanus]|uniref:3-ketodihydrosphingosine reductase-like n=1 Tax=Paramacrobiotus metropolitanus TaxID=2943436 RepID=UPI0024464658|nr:3-ketodihydrosphingosine reductase-like [Paramacrobiotus metropolitanus]
MAILLIAISIVSFLFLLYMISPLLAPKQMNLRGVHVLITGGSYGIGFSVAKEAFRLGAHVTIVARGAAKLKEAKDQILALEPLMPSQKVAALSLDITDAKNVPLAFSEAVEANGPIDVLINCAGTSSAQIFEDIPLEEFHRLMDINYFGSVYCTKCVVPSMKQRRAGRIVFVSSQAGQVGLYGFSAYSATKFALRGLAEALEMELKPFNIHVTLVHPPDTDTPGFKEEEKTKPQINRAISQTAGLYSADQVARILLDDTQSGKFLSYVGIDGFMLTCVSAGMSPVISIMEPLQQFFLAGLFRCIGLAYRRYFDAIVKRGVTEKTRS